MSEIPTIEIDMDKECGRCHMSGAGKGGLCLECVAESLKKSRFKAIGPICMHRIKAELCAMLDEYHDEIDLSYVTADGELSVSMGLKMVGTRMAGDVEVTAKMKFVESQVNHSIKFTVNEKQMKIPGV